jgi:hypothetical protein
MKVREIMTQLVHTVRAEATFRPPDLTPWCQGTARAAKAAWTLDFVPETVVAPVPSSSPW